MKDNNLHRVYFVGIGGIGMSALARYFNQKGLQVAGYDKVSTCLTQQLVSEGIDIHYEDNISAIPQVFLDRAHTLVVYTPAINTDHGELKYFRENNFSVEKRSTILGSVVNEGKGIAVAGTHGKTTISGMIAHILHSSGVGCNAFLGGISKNFDSNYVLNSDSEIFVVEADEYDRSFLTLHPSIAVITAIDPDHLDIYGDADKLRTSFSSFASQLKNGGTLIIKKGIDLDFPRTTKTLTYSMNGNADYYSYNIQRKQLRYSFSIHTPSGDIHDVETGIFGRINIENSIAAFAACVEAGVKLPDIAKALTSYKGIKRRFDIIIRSDEFVFIDDYAHHPEELKAFILSVKDAFPGKRITGIFQPHLYTRTRDFADGFAASLSLLDNVILLDIYPAREKPLEGISSAMIHNQLTNKGQRILCKFNELVEIVKDLKPEVLLNMGAGDIDLAVEPLRKSFEKGI